MRIKWPLTIFTTAMVLAGGYYYFFVTKKVKDSLPITKQEELSRADLIAQNLANKYQATTDWEKDSKFTLQLQERLTTERPVLFEEGYIEDIFTSGDKKIIRFSIPYFYKNNYMLELECNQEIVDRILREQNTEDFYPYGGYAIVANIQEISKQTPLEMSGSVYLNENYLNINLESTDTFFKRNLY